MVDRVIVEFVGPWRRLEKAMTSKRWGKNFAREAATATKINSLIIQRLIRQAIASGGSFGRANKGLTKAIKGSSSPLIDYGDLMANVSHRVVSPFEAYIGILRTAGPEMQNIASIVHDGRVIAVSENMRTMFAQLYHVSIGKASETSLYSKRAQELWQRFKTNAGPRAVWPSLGSKSRIVIPPRPFTRWALRSSQMQNKVLVNYVVAAVRAFIIPGVSSGAPGYIH